MNPGPDQPRALLRRLEQRARRRFGQHFLTRRDIVERMALGARITAGDRVLEIGPGLGILTEALLATGASITAVELDRDLCGHLRETYPTLNLVEADAAAVDWADLCPGSGWKVVANLPYNVGTGMLMELLEHGPRFASITVMLQAEVVHRLVADSGSRTYGSLSVRAQVRGTPRMLFPVTPGAFVPPPKVQSAVLQVVPFSNPQTGAVHPGEFDRTVRAAFSQRRKMIRNSLTPLYGRQTVADALEKSGISGESRAEQLDLEGFRALAAALYGHS